MNARELAAEAAEIKNRIRTLTSNIAAKAGTALNGGGPAVLSQVKAWQTERRDLEDRLELVDAALRSPELRPASELDAKLARVGEAFSRKWPRHQANYRGRVQFEQQETARYITLCLGDRENRLLQAQEMADALASLPYRVAADICGVVRVKEELEGARLGNRIHGDNPANANPEKIARLEPELALRERQARELVADTELAPAPPELAQAIGLLRARQANYAGSVPTMFVGPQTI